MQEFQLTAAREKDFLLLTTIMEEWYYIDLSQFGHERSRGKVEQTREKERTIEHFPCSA